jgi:hypothetical protein
MQAYTSCTCCAHRESGVKNYFVEQSWDVTVWSVAFLKTLNVA